MKRTPHPPIKHEHVLYIYVAQYQKPATDKSRAESMKRRSRRTDEKTSLRSDLETASLYSSPAALQAKLPKMMGRKRVPGKCGFIMAFMEKSCLNWNKVSIIKKERKKWNALIKQEMP